MNSYSPRNILLTKLQHLILTSYEEIVKSAEIYELLLEILYEYFDSHYSEQIDKQFQDIVLDRDRIVNLVRLLNAIGPKFKLLSNYGESREIFHLVMNYGCIILKNINSTFKEMTSKMRIKNHLNKFLAPMEYNDMLRDIYQSIIEIQHNFISSDSQMHTAGTKKLQNSVEMINKHLDQLRDSNKFMKRSLDAINPAAVEYESYKKTVVTPVYYNVFLELRRVKREKLYEEKFDRYAKYYTEDYRFLAGS